MCEHTMSYLKHNSHNSYHVYTRLHVLSITGIKQITVMCEHTMTVTKSITVIIVIMCIHVLTVTET